MAVSESQKKAIKAYREKNPKFILILGIIAVTISIILKFL